MSPDLQTLNVSNTAGATSLAALVTSADLTGVGGRAGWADDAPASLPPPRMTCLLLQPCSRPDDDLPAKLARDDLVWLHATSVDTALTLLNTHDDVALACVDAPTPGAGAFALAEQLRAACGARALPLIVIADADADADADGDGDADADADADADKGQHGQRWVQGRASGAAGAAVAVLRRPLAPGALESCTEHFLQLHRERRALARERASCDDAMRLNAMVADVLGHDLRSPLSAILMSAEILKRRPEEALQKTGARLARSATWMSRMIQDMLDLTRARLGLPMALQLQPLALAPLLQSVLDERAQAFPANPLRVEQHGDLRGQWDATRLRQLLSALVGNALHHGEPGQAVDVQVDGRAADSVRVDVRNHGAIPPALLPHLFDPLHAGRQPSPPEGLGFGLYIAREIARAHGGELNVESTARSGTRVQVTLPRGGVAAPSDGDR